MILKLILTKYDRLVNIRTLLQHKLCKHKYCTQLIYLRASMNAKLRHAYTRTCTAFVCVVCEGEGGHEVMISPQLDLPTQMDVARKAKI